MADHTRLESSATIVSDSATLAASPQSSGFSSKPSPVNGSTNGTSTDSILPPEHPFRTLVLCFDGTGDQFDSDNSNIVELFGMLKKDDPSKQLVYYQAGIGTYTTPQIATPFWTNISKTIDMAIAWNLDAHIMGGYEFLMQNYRIGDRICIFGFSRGAYTARCLAGMVHKVGLLPICNSQQIPFAYKMYTLADETGWKQSNLFKKTFSIDVDIEFVGVWDTVNSVGLIPRRLPFAASNTAIRTFRHALSLDEHRSKFKANTWNRPDEKEQVLSISDKPKAKKAHAAASKKPRGMSLHDLEDRYGKDRTQPTDVDEVWFAGCHCDVGGGSVDNDIKPNLARIPLRWMIRECFKTNNGVMFHTEGLRSVGLDPAALYPVVLPRPPALSAGATGPTAYIQTIPKTPQPPLDEAEVALSIQESEEEHDLKDALSPIYDQLALAWGWWILEIVPMRHRYQEDNDKWQTEWKSNWGKGRHVPLQHKDGVKVHRTVKTRLEAEYANGQKYKPKSNLKLDCVEWVD